MTINNFDKNELPGKPENFDQQPEQKVKLKVHLPDQGVS
jgi:hypothetical protein